jgi:hypothetical protein
VQCLQHPHTEKLSEEEKCPESWNKHLGLVLYFVSIFRRQKMSSRKNVSGLSRIAYSYLWKDEYSKTKKALYLYVTAGTENSVGSTSCRAFPTLTKFFFVLIANKEQVTASKVAVENVCSAKDICSSFDINSCMLTSGARCECERNVEKPCTSSFDLFSEKYSQRLIL